MNTVVHLSTQLHWMIYLGDKYIGEIQSIMRDPLFLAGKSEPATEADKQVVQDLLDTLKANQDTFEAYKEMDMLVKYER